MLCDTTKLVLNILMSITNRDQDERVDVKHECSLIFFVKVIQFTSIVI